MAKPDIDYDRIAERLREEGFPHVPTLKQMYFCYFYADEANGMKAIRDAGFNHTTAGSQSSASYRLLQKKAIQRLINHFKGIEPLFNE